MGTYVFTWTSPAEEVIVTGTFDNWSKSVHLAKESGIFEKQIDLPSTSEDIEYKFFVDGKWEINSHQPTKKDDAGNENNLLRKEDITPIPTGGRSHTGTHPTPNTVSAVTSNQGPGATSSAQMEKGAASASAEDHMPGTFPSETPSKDAGGYAPSAMDFFSAGDIVPDFSTYKSATLPTGQSKPSDDEQKKGDSYTGEAAGAVGAGLAAAGTAAAVGAQKAKETTGVGKSDDGEQKFGVNPLPATSGAGNPIHPAPGEKLPPTNEFTANTTTSNVKLDKESYEKSDAYPSSQNKSLDTSAGAMGVPPVTSNMIPESSLPMGKNNDVSDGPADVTAIRSAAGSNTTTAQLAGQVPKEPRGVPEVVRDSEQEAHASPEAATNPTAVAEKSEVENELKSKVPEQPATSDNSTLKTAAASVAAGGAAVAGGAAAYAAGVVPTSISNAFSSLRGGNTNEKPADAVPETVKESEKEAHVAPEAAANPEAVQEKSAVEKELMSKVPTTDAAGEPAPAFSTAQYTVAPAPQTGTEGGQGKDHTADTDDKKSTTAGEKAAAVGAAATGAAAAVGGAAAATASKAGETAKSAADSATGNKMPVSGTASSTSAFAHDPTEAGSKQYSTDSGAAPMTTTATSGGAKDAIPSTEGPKSAGTGEHALEDEGTAAAIGAMDMGTAGPSGAGAEKDAEGGLNASKEAPAQSVATEAKQLGSEADQGAKPAVAATDAPTGTTVTTEEKKPEKDEDSHLPGTTMLPTSAKQKQREDSRDVSPMTRPEVTTGTDKKSTEGASKGHARNESAMSGAGAAGSSAGASAEDKKSKRRSLFGRIKDKLKH